MLKMQSQEPAVRNIKGQMQVQVAAKTASANHLQEINPKTMTAIFNDCRHKAALLEKYIAHELQGTATYNDGEQE